MKNHRLKRSNKQSLSEATSVVRSGCGKQPSSFPSSAAYPQSPEIPRHGARRTPRTVRRQALRHHPPIRLFALACSRLTGGSVSSRFGATPRLRVSARIGLFEITANFFANRLARVASSATVDNAAVTVSDLDSPTIFQNNAGAVLGDQHTTQVLPEAILIWLRPTISQDESNQHRSPIWHRRDPGYEIVRCFLGIGGADFDSKSAPEQNTAR